MKSEGTKRTTDMPETSVLLPCPFCGGDKARTIHIRDGRKVACVCGACGNPEFHGPLDKPNAESRAITAWNTRAVSAAEGDLLWRCLEALDKIHGWLVCHSIASADDMAQMFPEMTAVAEDVLSQAREVTR